MVDVGLKKTKNEPPVPTAPWSRVVIEGVTPEVDGGKYPAKRVRGDVVTVCANIHADGHNVLACVLTSRKKGKDDWLETKMQLVQPGLDLYEGQFSVDKLGVFEFTIHCWIDRFANWKRDTAKKLAAGQDIAVELEEVYNLIQSAAAASVDELDGGTLLKCKNDIRNAPEPQAAMAIATQARLEDLMHEHLPRVRVCQYEKILPVMVEPERAQYSTWYELFPRSVHAAGNEEHGTFKDVVAHLPYVAQMGFDVLYLPPIHPIGAAHRKGKNNSLKCETSDPGSPWAIGSEQGGHKALHPQLGTMAEFEDLIAAAKVHGVDIAMDIAFQCSPDHPYVKEHPDWFYHRPDGSIRYAENPPKKYEDIYPIDFESSDWQNLWRELTDVVLFWVEHGVRIFRVDNPHTKPFAFWQYLIDDVKSARPDAIFLSEAFARPKIMYHLAKVGFSQSYSYFTWRNHKEDITAYFSELYKAPLVDYFRPNLFINTPDILPEFLQFGGRAAHMIRVVLAATLGASYGMYGPAFELCASESTGGTEEYLDSEKYEIKQWDTDRKDSLAPFITRLNKIRKDNPALQQNRNLKFLQIDNGDMIAYAKTSADGLNAIVTVVNLDPHNPQAGTLHLPTADFGADNTYQVHDLITGMRFLWNGESNYVRLEPHVSPAFVFKILKKIRTERDFDYFV
jgi:starch synthase (maltosyl-transferring)